MWCLRPASSGALVRGVTTLVVCSTLPTKLRLKYHPHPCSHAGCGAVSGCPWVASGMWAGLMLLPCMSGPRVRTGDPGALFRHRNPHPALVRFTARLALLVRGFLVPRSPAKYRALEARWGVSRAQGMHFVGQCWGLQGRGDPEVCPDGAAARSEEQHWTSLGCWARSPLWGPLVSDQRYRWKLYGLESAHLIPGNLRQVDSSLCASVSFSRRGPQDMLLKEGGREESRPQVTYHPPTL